MSEFYRHTPDGMGWELVSDEENGRKLPEIAHEFEPDDVNKEVVERYQRKVDDMLNKVTTEISEFDNDNLTSENKKRILEIVNMKDGEISLLADEVWSLVYVTNKFYGMDKNNSDIKNPDWANSETEKQNIIFRNLHNDLIVKRLELKKMLGDENPDVLNRKQREKEEEKRKRLY